MRTDRIKKIVDSRIFILGMLGCLFIIESVPAFRSAVYEGHDLKFHFGRIQAIAEALRSGQFPVRYEQNAWYGHGYVSSLFYGNIFLYVPALLYMAGMPVFRAYNIYVIISNIATIVIGYYSFKRLLNNKILGVTATVIYTLSGYRLANLYVRTSLGEFTAMAFVPLCVYGIYRIYLSKEQKPSLKKLLPLVAGISGLIQSHILMTEMIVAAMIVFAVVNFRQTKRVFRDLLLAAGLTFTVNAFFIIPFVQSYFTLRLNVNASGVIDDIQKNGLYLSQIFGLITQGRGYNAEWSTEHEECYRTGLLILICEVLIVAYILKLIFQKGIALRNQKSKYAIQVVVIGIIATWMSTVYFPWNVMPQLGGFGKLLAAIQYPCRYLAIQLICFTIGGVHALKWLFKRARYRVTALFMISTIALVTTGIFDYTLSYGTNMTDEHAADEWADKLYLPVGTDAALLSDAQVVVKSNEIILPVLAYDNVQVFGEAGERIQTHVSDNNCIAVSSSVDVDRISIKYIEPFLWRASEVISLVSIIGIILFMLRNKRTM